MASPLLLTFTCPQSAPVFRTHQLWASSSTAFPSSEGYVFEILGFKRSRKQLVTVRIWKLYPDQGSGRIRPGSDLQHAETSTNLLSIGIFTHYTIDQLFTGPTLSITTRASFRRKDSPNTLFRTIHHVRPSSVPLHPFGIPTTIPDCASWSPSITASLQPFNFHDPDDLTIYTDGSWKLTGSGVLSAINGAPPMGA